jgi:hypothetical protein
VNACVLHNDGHMDVQMTSIGGPSHRGDGAEGWEVTSDELPCRKIEPFFPLFRFSSPSMKAHQSHCW